MPGRATESGAQPKNKEKEPPTQPLGANSRKRVAFAKVVEVITLGDKVDQASFQLLHHFATRPNSKLPLNKDVSMEQHQTLPVESQAKKKALAAVELVGARASLTGGSIMMEKMVKWKTPR